MHYIYDSAKQVLPRIHPTNLSHIMTQDFYAECEEKYKQTLTFFGQQKRKFLQQCPNIDLDQIATNFQSPDAYFPLTHEESDAINLLMWNIYSSD